MLQLARTVVAYHGCDESHAHRLLLSGGAAIAAWRPSQNTYDWLGEGIYFWEDSAVRAMSWAIEHGRRKGWAKPAVIGAVISLGRCFDLLDEQYTELLKRTYDQVAQEYASANKPLPQNRLGRDLKLRDLDCMIINRCIELFAALDFQTVRGAFLEGPEVYPGAKIHEQSHIQIAVRDRRCILGVFAPNLTS